MQTEVHARFGKRVALDAGSLELVRPFLREAPNGVLSIGRTRRAVFAAIDALTDERYKIRMRRSNPGDYSFFFAADPIVRVVVSGVFFDLRTSAADRSDYLSASLRWDRSADTITVDGRNPYSFERVVRVLERPEGPCPFFLRPELDFFGIDLVRFENAALPNDDCRNATVVEFPLTTADKETGTFFADCAFSRETYVTAFSIGKAQTSWPVSYTSKWAGSFGQVDFDAAYLERNAFSVTLVSDRHALHPFCRSYPVPTGQPIRFTIRNLHDTGTVVRFECAPSDCFRPPFYARKLYPAKLFEKEMTIDRDEEMVRVEVVPGPEIQRSWPTAKATVTFGTTTKKMDRIKRVNGTVLMQALDRFRAKRLTVRLEQPVDTPWSVAVYFITNP